VSSDTGKLKVDKVSTAPFEQKQLLSGDCFIVDDGSNRMIMVWKGMHDFIRQSESEVNQLWKNLFMFVERRTILCKFFQNIFQNFSG